MDYFKQKISLYDTESNLRLKSQPQCLNLVNKMLVPVLKKSFLLFNRMVSFCMILRNLRNISTIIRCHYLDISHVQIFLNCINMWSSQSQGWFKFELGCIVKGLFAIDGVILIILNLQVKIFRIHLRMVFSQCGKMMSIKMEEDG